INNKGIYSTFGIIISLLIITMILFFNKVDNLKTTIIDQQTQIDSLKLKGEEGDSMQVSSSIDNTSNSNQENQSESSEDFLWDTTKKIDTFDAYLEFIKSEGQEGKHKKNAIQRLFELGISGWLYSGRSENGKYYSDDQLVKVTWRNNSSQDLDDTLPELGDIVALRSQEARRTYPDFLPRSNQNGIWPLGKSAYVIDVRMEGKTAVILKVVYERP
ncbi:MAG: hypothetical protein KJP09_02485, partial [Bacteroidia bacterium]|nr:hypothetical protein [Bacteroidia bacterium]